MCSPTRVIKLSDAGCKSPLSSQWLPAGCALPYMLRKQEGDVEGVCEPGVVREAGSVVQFERVGFARIDDTAGDRSLLRISLTGKENPWSGRCAIGLVVIANISELLSFEGTNIFSFNYSMRG